MRIQWLALICPPLCLAACGGAGTPPGVSPNADILTGKEPKAIVVSAQSWLRTGHYAFDESLAQESTGTGLSGLPDDATALANSRIQLTAKGVAAGDQHVSLDATVTGDNSSVHLIELGCDGFSSTDGTHWSSGSQQRWLTRMIAPSLEDALTTLSWRDLGVETRDSETAHHLQADLTALGLSGAPPRPDATPPPGVTVANSPIDLWVGSSTGWVVELDSTADAVVDVAAAGIATHHTGTGTVHQHLHQQVTFAASSATVSAPASTLPHDPLPVQIYLGFGWFGIQRDTCEGSPSPPTA